MVVQFSATGADFPREGAQRQQLPVPEHRAPSVETVPRDPDPEALLTRSRLVGQAERDVLVERREFRLLDSRSLDFPLPGPPVLLAGGPIHDHGGHHRVHPSGASFDPEVFHRHDVRTARTARAGAAGRPLPGPGRLHGRGLDPLLYTEHYARPVRVRFHSQQDALPRTPTQPTGLQQRQFRPAPLALDRPRPEVRRRRLSHPPRIPAIRQVAAVESLVQRVRRHPPLRIGREITRFPFLVRPVSPPQRNELGIDGIARGEPPPRPGEHAAAPRPNLPSQVPVDRLLEREHPPRLPAHLRGALGLHRIEPRRDLAPPIPPALPIAVYELPVGPRETRQRPRLPCEPLRVLQRAPEKEPRHRVDVRRLDLAPEPHRLQRYRPAPGERIQHARRPPPEGPANVGPKLLDPLFLFASPVQDPAHGHPLRRGHPPPPRNLVPAVGHHRTRHPRMEIPPLPLAPGIRQQRPDERRPTRRQRPPRRPDMQRGQMPMPHILLMSRIQRHRLQRKPHLDQPLRRRHAATPRTHCGVRTANPSTVMRSR